LITNGLFAYVRHPIYALSILLMLATVSVTLSVAMTLVGVIHISMLYTKALSEERHLKGTHGPKYARYCEQTGRFVPRLVAPSHPQDEDSTPQDSPPKAA
jgi:protein-S-isoprenylcysteine O-methyltransferase Ste14